MLVARLELSLSRLAPLASRLLPQISHLAPLRVEFIPIDYDHERLAAEMRAERLPEEFIDTILTGWWTTCLEVLPAKERRRGRY